MLNKNFYPTPERVIATMLRQVDYTGGYLNNYNILEPSAGKGDICDYIRKQSEHATIHCIEKEPDLQATLMGKGYPVVHDDFLTFTPDEAYDLIVMNPPFDAGGKHLLHAWEILPYGQIVCLLNAETLNNQHSTTRQALGSLIAQHGTVQNLGPCFMYAERPTTVDVVLVHLKKKRPEVKYTLFEGMEEEYAQEIGGTDHGQQIATKNTIGNLVLAYERSMAIFAEVAPKLEELGFYLDQLGAKEAMTALAKSVGVYVDDRENKHRHNQQASFTKALKGRAWGKVIDMTSAKRFMSSGVLPPIPTDCDSCCNYVRGEFV